MIRIGDINQPSVEELREAIRGLWGVEESNEMTEIAIGNLNVRVYSNVTEIAPISFRKGTSDEYVSSLALLSFADGTSAIQAVTAPKIYAKTITMGLLIARQA